MGDDLRPVLRHPMLVHDSEVKRRRRTAAWVADGLACGHKVLYAVADDGPTGRSEIDGMLGAGWERQYDGQLELVDAADRFAATGGEHSALLELQERQVREALADGFPSVASAASSEAVSTMVPDRAELLAYEVGLDRLAADPRVRLLCSYDVRALQPDLLDDLSAVHFQRLDDVLWAAEHVDGTLVVRGEVDQSNADRFATVLQRSIAAGVRTVNLEQVSFLSGHGVRVLAAAAGDLHARRERLDLVRVPPIVARVLALSGISEHEGVSLRSLYPTREGSDSASDSPGEVETAESGERSPSLRPEFPPETARIIAGALGSASSVSVTVGSPGRPAPLVVNDLLAERMDDAQRLAGNGPSRRAWEERRVVISQRLPEDARWPELAALAEPLGVRAVLAVPVVVAGEIVGVVNAYSAREDAFAAVDVDLAELVAFTVASMIRRVEEHGQLQATIDNLRQALTSRAQIDQAKGVMMALHGYDTDAAFEAISQISQRDNVKVREVARLLLEQVQRHR
ncbi:MAG: MEDS domain-containing protein [Nocardioidaceae bacterium]